MAVAKKEFHQYLTTPTNVHVGHFDYIKSPGTAFLKYTVEAKSAIDLCTRKFPKKADNRTYVKDSLDSLQHLVVAMVPAVLGHFETYQRYLFAGMYDASVHLDNFDVDDFLKRLAKVSEVSIDPVRLAAHRGLGAESIGLLMADSLSGWHSPDRVNALFNAFNLKHQLYSADDCGRLNVLWQIRHSIVHTGGTLTLADAQKAKELADYGNKKLVFENRFIYEISRKLHPLIKQATEGMGNAFKQRLKASTTAEVRHKLDELFSVKSSVAIWLRS